MAQGHKTGGRKKGTPNQATIDIKAAFQKHGAALVKALLKLTESDDERIRLGALQACLDRGWGKPTQAVEVGEKPKDSAGPETSTRCRGRSGGPWRCRSRPTGGAIQTATGRWRTPTSPASTR